MARFRSAKVRIALLAAGLSLAAAPGGIPAETAKLYAAFQAGYGNPNISNSKLLTDLAAAPDGDLCLLDAAMWPNRDWPAIMAGHALAKLHTPRTIARLNTLAADAGDTQRSARAINLLGEIADGKSVAVLLDVLAKGNEDRRSAVVDVLARFDDPRVAPALLKAVAKNDFVAERAVSALASLKSPAVFDCVVANFRKTTVEQFYKVQATNDLAAYGNAAAANLLVGRMQELDGKTDDESTELRGITAGRLDELFRPAEAALAPTLGELSDPFADEWKLYWTAARPLLTDALRPKCEPATKPAPPVYAPSEYAATADRVAFFASVNAPVFRFGDPIRIDLRLVNNGTAPVSTIPPVPHACWFPQMAYGIKLTHDGKTLFEIQPSDAYMGSYTGPPACVTLAPGAACGSAVCLQRWLDSIETPLAEGAYELSITYDSSKFAGLQLTAIDRTHCWTAAPVRFTVRGPARTQPADVMAYIAGLVGKPFLEHDLTSENEARGESAHDAMLEFGDSRIAAPRPYERPATP